MIKFFIVIIACAFAFWPALSAGFLQFDDPQHIFLNPAVIYFPDSIQLIFTQSINKIYLPLTTLSFAVEKFFFGLNPFIFHLNNLILHIAVCWIVFIFTKRLNITSMAAFFAVLVFAVHPMKVESVAWATERKDVLYSLFYMLALVSYTKYITDKSSGAYAFAIVWAMLSILSKPMALSLPLILFLLDWYFRRGFNLKTVMEKIPFMAIAGGIGWITYAQNMRNPIADFSSALLVWIWSCGFYIWKFLFPANVYAFYKLPMPVHIYTWAYGLSLVFFVLALMSLIIWRRRRLYIFAGAYFFLSIFFLLRFDVGVDASVVNDRFMYLPCLGFCILLGIFSSNLWKSRVGKTFVIILIGLMIYKTHLQSRVWQSTLSFYNEVIRAYPDAFSGYNNRAHYYYGTGQLTLALADYNKAIELSPGFARNYIGRGTMWGMLGQHQKAIDDFSTALSIEPSLGEAYFNRSIAQKTLGLYIQAYGDAQKAKNMGIPIPADYLEQLQSLINSP